VRRIILFVLSFAFLFNAFGLLPAAAQEAKGSIAGTVKDSSGGSLKGALIELDPTAKRAVSDDQGQFKITDVVAGEYMLTVSYVGLSNFSAAVKVSAGQTASADAVLNIAGMTDQMVVTAERLQGEAEAINIERTADDIVQVLPQKVISSLPNTNIADAVGRLPSVTLERDEGEGKYVQIRGTEPRLSNMTINGVNIPSPESNVRNIKMDVIPSALVDRIEVSKTLSANQDADAIGGSVNLVTKTAGDQPTVSLEGLGGYTPIQDGRWLDSFNGNVGQRFGENKKFGVMFGGTYDYNMRGIDDVETGQGTYTFAGGPSAGKSIQYISGGIDTREYQYYRTRYGFATGLDYRANSETTFFLKGLYSDFHDYGSTYVYTYNAGTPTAPTVNGITPMDATGFMQYREYIRRPDQQIWSFSTGGRHDLTSTLITYSFSVSRSHQYGGFQTTNYTPDPNGPLSNVQFNMNTTDPLRPKLVVVGNTPVLDPSQYFISQQENIDSHTADLALQGAATYARRYTAGSHLGTFEMGFEVRNSHKDNFSNNPYYDVTQSPILALSNVTTNFTNPNYYGGSYTLGPLSSYDRILSLLSANPNLLTFNSDNTHLKNDAANYNGNERVIAGYLMNTINFGKNRLQGGVRFEATNETYTANLVQAPGGTYLSTTPVSGSGSYLNVLPSVQWQYMLPRNTDLRVSYSMGISRPNFSDLVPSQQVDANASPKSLVEGNPSLKATKAQNFDVLVEHFFQPLGILQAGFFYKALSDPIYPTTTTLPSTDPNFPNYQVQESINGPSAHITGFEAAWEQRLSFLPGLLNGFGVAANYSYTTSQVTFPGGFNNGRTDKPALQRQAPNTWNLGFTYDKSRFSMRFGVSHNDANIYAYNYQASGADSDPILGLKGPTGDIYLYAHTQFDVQGSYQMHKGLKLVVSGLNLSNEVFGFYQGSPIYPIQREYYKPSVSFGLRWSMNGE
jgi:TonB-dependent receptor